MNTYKLRAECPSDLEGLARALKESSIKATLATEQDAASLPDCEAIITTVEPIEIIRDIVRTVVDGHVMVQTLKPEADYDGVRNYDL
ncbi:MAG: hypothetical protein WAW41_15795 [Methylobacter sp.]